ncbi:MAG: hydrogenase nickel incorporation protein HypB [bacterium]
MKIEVVRNILDANDQVAYINREMFDQLGVKVVNIMAAPGAGKTSLILKTAEVLNLSIAVIEGDVASTIDSEKVASKGISVVQINTGGECHLDAPMIKEALKRMNLDGVKVLFIENVGNLICPAGFELGEHIKVAVSSVPEGDDKPYKYPGLFSKVSAVVLNKMDILPYIDFNVKYFENGVRALNPKAKIFPVSCKTGEGLQEWVEWLKSEAVSR